MRSNEETTRASETLCPIINDSCVSRNGLKQNKPFSFRSLSLFFITFFSVQLSFTELTLASPGQESIAPGAKGIVGGALLGAELTVGVESLVGLHQTWQYGLGAGLGAVAGGVGGYYVGKASTAAGTGLLISGIFLAIPATVLMLNGLRYRPPTQEGDARQLARFQQHAPLAFRPPPGLIGRYQGHWAVNMPTIMISELSTPDEQFIFGAQTGPLVDVSLLQLCL